MKSLDFPYTSFIIFVLHFLLFGHAEAHAAITYYVHNNCHFPIWPATAANTGRPVIAEGGFYLPSGQTHQIIVPSAWSGRIWGRTGCNFESNYGCETGDCDGRLKCNGLIGEPPVTLLEITHQGDQGDPTYYDVSLVDGYNLPLTVAPKATSPRCVIGGCSKNLKKICPNELRVLNHNGQVVACKSACLAFNKDNFCCRNEYGSPDKCRPSKYSKIFKDACPAYYSYAFDSPPPLMNCVANEFVITFCPSTWGEEVSSI